MEIKLQRWRCSIHIYFDSPPCVCYAHTSHPSELERSQPLLIAPHTQYQGVSTADSLAKATLRQADKAIKTVPINAPWQ